MPVSMGRASLGATPFARRGRVWYSAYTTVVPMSRMCQRAVRFYAIFNVI